MSEGKSQNINISGGTIGGLQIGDGNTQQVTQNFGEQPASVDALFAAVKDSLKYLPEADRDSFEDEVVEPLRVMATMPEEEQRAPGVMERAKSLFGRLAPFAPTISRAVVAFSEASLATLATENPIVSGLLAAVKAVNNPAQ